MASSTSFRGRRVIDPVLIQRGSLPKDSKQRSSFSDLAAAWENVGEAKSALEAAEARINEANAGLGPELEEEERPDLPLQEIFSETQRYGRVTRYELRPNSYGRAVPLAPRLVGEERPPRRMIDYPLNAERQQLRARAPGHPLLSPPSRDIHGTSSLNSVITNNSDALARLKERIKQQKEQASRSSPESVQGNMSPRNNDPFGAAPIIPPRAELDVQARNVISVRKVASAPAAPAYKGFSEVESKTTALSEVNRKVKSKGPDNHRVKRGNQRPPKPKKVPPKVQRVLAPRRPADIITTSSWRAGQQTVKRILGPVKKKKTSPPRSRPHSSSSQDTDVSEVKGLNMEWKADDTSKEDDDRGNNDSSGGSSRRSEAERERAKSPPGSDHVEDLDKQDKDLDAEPAKLLSGARVEDTGSTADRNVKELKGSKMISTEARNILSDLELDSDESDEDVKQTVPEPRPKISLAKKSSKKRKAPGPEKKEMMYPTQKVRHYDADEVKKYMAKQMADRKKRLKEDRLHKEKALEERKKKLEELYNKQKKNLRNNLTHRDKNTMGETYLKGHGDLRSIIYPYSRPFLRDEVECYSEDAGVSESDKENLDIASFRGLPIHSTSKSKYRNSDDLDRESTASSPLETSRDFNMSPDHEMEVERGKSNQVPCVTSVTVGTRMADNRPSAYVGFPEESFGSDQERPRDDIPTTRSNLHPRSGSPDQALLDRERGGNRSPIGVGRVKPLSPPRDNRIASIKLTAAQLQHRLESEARRLGINLQATALGEMDDHLPTSAPASDHTVFNGALPGVGNLHEQADLNQELDTMTSAATTIQAAYRGHSVRQGLNWRLPSGQTLRSTVRQAVYQKPAPSGAGLSESSQYSTARDTVVSNADRSISEAGSLYSSSSSLIQPSKLSSLKVDKLPSTGGSSMHETERRFESRGHLPGYSKAAKPSSLPWRSSGGDSMSVINIFARKNPHLRLTRPEDESLNERGSETASLLDETAQGNIGANDTASLLEPVADLNQSEELLEQTLVAGSPDRSKEQHEYEDDYTGSSTLGSEENQHEESGKRSPSRDKNVDESAVYSESFVSPESSRTEHKTKSPNETLQSGPLSPTLSEGDLSHVSDTAERSRALSPVRHSPTKEREVPGSSHQFSPPAPVRLPPPVFMPRSEAGSRISPGSLDMRLTAELNRLEYMEESVRQITDVERTRSVSLAQQETVSLAQILKSKQLTHAREMENLRAKAREEALESAKQLEEARRAAADAAAGAAETIARMRLETAAVISDSADHLVKVQTEAARTTAESAKHVEEARTSAARTLLEAAQQQAADTRGVAAEAASAAAEAAVKSTMTRFHEQQEQILKEREALMKSYRNGTRDERPRDSYASYTSGDRTDSYSRSRTSRLGTETLDRSRKSPGTGTYTSDDFESSKGSHREKDTSVQTASNLSIDRTASHSRRTPTLSVPASRSRHDSPTGERTGSIPEMMEQSLADSVVSDIGLDVAEDQSLIEALTDDKAKKDHRDLSLAGEADYTLNFEESVISSHTATDDEIDYRMILPSESHRRRSLGKTGRSGSIGSDQGTVSYSSDDNHESQELRAEKTLEEISAAPFSAEDSFSQFTSEMVRLMKEEEVRAKHQDGLLRLREKALKEKTRAEMAWLELQKQRHRDKGADDVMPSIRKRQRGVLMRLQAEQAEIKRLKAANRAASYERRLLLMQQEEIAQLRKTTKRIRETANTERTTHGEDGETLKPGEHVELELPKSEADSTGVPEELEDKPADQSTRSRSAISEDIKAASPNTSASVAEELPEASRTESFPSHGSRESGAGERKRTLSEGESDDGSAMESTHSAAKGSPTASDATVMQKLKKLRSQSSERYLTQREQKLMKRRKEAENLLENKKKLLEWERRLDKEESLVKNLLNEALSLERSKGRATSITSEDDEQKDRSGRVSASPSVSKSSSKAGEKDRSAQRTPSISESIKRSESRGHERSASESSVPEDITISARDRSRDTEKSADSSIPEVEMKTRSQGSSIPEEIPEEYVNDTFESVDSTVVTPTHSTPVRSDLSFKRDASPTVSRRSSKDEGSKSEEEASMTETSDYNSDIESRVRRLKDQLELRKREVKRLYNERKRQRKAMLRAQEASLRKELQAVEMVISRTKAELNRPQAESNRTDSNSNSVEQRPTPTKSESSDTIREVRYNLSRTSDAGGSRKISPPDKAVTVSSRNESAGGRAPSVVNVEETASGVSSLREERSVLAEGSRNSVGSLSAGLRQPSDSERSEHKSSVRELNDLKGDVEEEAMTAEDLSFSEGGKIQSKASLAEKSIEERSRSLGESLSGSHRQLSGSHRQPSGSVPTSLSQERQDSEVDIDSEVKTAVDLSLSEGSEVQTRSKPSFSETSIRENVRKSVPDATDGLEESIHSRSGKSTRTSESKPILPESFRESRPSLPEKSHSVRTDYSSSFESAHSEEEEKTEADISEHISIEEDAKESDVSEVIDSVKDSQERENTAVEQEKGRDVENTQEASEISEEIFTDEKEKSDIEDDLPSTRKTVSISGGERAEMSRDEGSNLLKPAENEEQLPSYSADFEPSGIDELEHEEKSDNLTPPVSYTPEFEASESNIAEEHENSEELRGQHESSSVHLKELEHSGSDGEHVKERSRSEQLRDSSSFSREKLQHTAQVAEQVTDEESIAEDISENVQDLDESETERDRETEETAWPVGFRKETEEGVLYEGKNDSKRGEMSPIVLPTTDVTRSTTDVNRSTTDDNRSTTDVNRSTTDLTREQPEKKSVVETVERITDDLSAMLLKESTNCVTMMFEKRRRTTEVVPEDVADTPEKSRSDERNAFVPGVEDTFSMKEDEDAIPESPKEDVSEAEDDISEHVGYSDGEDSVSGLDFGTDEREKEALASQAGQLRKSRDAQGDGIVGKLSEALLKEAASQMIAIMRRKTEKLAASPSEQSSPSHPSHAETKASEPHSGGEESPLVSPRSSRFMAVQRFPEGLPKYAEETSPPPGSPTKEEAMVIDEKELADKLDQLRRLHEHLDGARDNRDEDEEDDRLEFNVISNSIIEFPSQDEEEEDEGFRRSRGSSFLFSVPHRPNDVSSLVGSSLSVIFDRKKAGLPLDNVTPPPEIIGDSEPGDDLEANSKRVYRRLVFDLSGNVLKELLTEEAPSHRPSWMKVKRRRKRRFYRSLEPLIDESDYLPVVEQQVLNLIGLGEARPSLESVRRKTPLKAGKKDLVDAILIQELREDEPLWIDYDDDELAVKFQVADAIFESLLSETVMVMNAVQLRREARMDALRS